jgi:hypothetical protein
MSRTENQKLIKNYLLDSRGDSSAGKATSATFSLLECCRQPFSCGKGRKEYSLVSILKGVTPPHRSGFLEEIEEKHPMTTRLKMAGGEPSPEGKPKSRTRSSTPVRRGTRVLSYASNESWGIFKTFSHNAGNKASAGLSPITEKSTFSDSNGGDEKRPRRKASIHRRRRWIAIASAGALHQTKRLGRLRPRFRSVKKKLIERLSNLPEKSIRRNRRSSSENAHRWMPGRMFLQQIPAPIAV